MRKRKPETEIRELKRELKGSKALVKEYHDEAYIQRGRATRAEQEAAEWKRRFDIILSRLPDVEAK